MSSDERAAMKDKIEQHHGLQLSALMDGELSPDEARFLLRRLQHDGELADCWERWQLAGEVLRGRAGVLLPDGFAGRVATALHSEAIPARRAPGLLRWGGVALAASVAVVALMVPRPAPDAQVAGGTPLATSVAGPDAPAMRPDVAGHAVAGQAVVAAPAPAEARVASPADASARVVASNDRPVRAARREPAPVVVASSDAAPSLERNADAIAATSPSQPASQAPATQDPFRDATLVSRPWPRAVLPQYGNGGALATGLPAGSGSQPPSFYPFEPRLPAQAGTRDQEPQPESAQPQAPR